MGRYDLPDPMCRHKATGRVTTEQVAGGAPFDGAHASAYVCDRPACIEDAKAWAFAETGLHAEFVSFNAAATANTQLNLAKENAS